MRLLILCTLYICLTPLWVFFDSDAKTNLGQFGISRLLNAIEFIFILVAIRENWLLKIPLGIMAALIFPVTAQMADELLFDKGEGVLRNIDNGLIAYLCLYVQTILLVTLANKFNKDRISSEKLY